MNQEQYIEHEVKLRVMKEVNDERFKNLEKIIKETRNFTRAILGTVITAIILPIIFHHYGFI